MDSSFPWLSSDFSHAHSAVVLVSVNPDICKDFRRTFYSYLQNNFGHTDSIWIKSPPTVEYLKKSSSISRKDVDNFSNQKVKLTVDVEYNYENVWTVVVILLSLLQQDSSGILNFKAHEDGINDLLIHDTNYDELGFEQCTFLKGGKTVKLAKKSGDSSLISSTKEDVIKPIPERFYKLIRLRQSTLESPFSPITTEALHYDPRLLGRGLVRLPAVLPTRVAIFMENNKTDLSYIWHIALDNSSMLAKPKFAELMTFRSAITKFIPPPITALKNTKHGFFSEPLIMEQVENEQNGLPKLITIDVPRLLFQAYIHATPRLPSAFSPNHWRPFIQRVFDSEKHPSKMASERSLFLTNVAMLSAFLCYGLQMYAEELGIENEEQFIKLTDDEEGDKEKKNHYFNDTSCSDLLKWPVLGVLSDFERFAKGKNEKTDNNRLLDNIFDEFLKKRCSFHQFEEFEEFEQNSFSDDEEDIEDTKTLLESSKSIISKMLMASDRDLMDGGSKAASYLEASIKESEAMGKWSSPMEDIMNLTRKKEEDQ